MTEKEVRKLAYALGTTLAVADEKIKKAIAIDVANVFGWKKIRRDRFLTAVDVYDKKLAARVWNQQINRKEDKEKDV